MLFDKNSNKKLKEMPSRFDMAVNFHCCIKKDNEYYVVGFFYNPAWNMFYPFYDDVNKTPILQKSKSFTCQELAIECDKVLNVNLDEKLQLASNRFREVFDCGCKVKKSSNFELYEIKYSKTANVYTIYKLFNYLIYEIDDVSKFLNSKMKTKLFNLDKLDNSDFVSNAVEFCKISKDELIKNAIKI